MIMPLRSLVVKCLLDRWKRPCNPLISYTLSLLCLCWGNLHSTQAYISASGGEFKPDKASPYHGEDLTNCSHASRTRRSNTQRTVGVRSYVRAVPLAWYQIWDDGSLIMLLSEAVSNLLYRWRTVELSEDVLQGVSKELIQWNHTGQLLWKYIIRRSGGKEKLVLQRLGQTVTDWTVDRHNNGWIATFGALHAPQLELADKRSHTDRFQWMGSPRCYV